MGGCNTKKREVIETRTGAVVAANNGCCGGTTVGRASLIREDRLGTNGTCGSGGTTVGRIPFAEVERIREREVRFPLVEEDRFRVDRFRTPLGVAGAGGGCYRNTTGLGADPIPGQLTTCYDQLPSGSYTNCGSQNTSASGNCLGMPTAWIVVIIIILVVAGVIIYRYLLLRAVCAGKVRCPKGTALASCQVGGRSILAKGDSASVKILENTGPVEEF
jgi:hypothetical protein